ncbi:MAG: molybdopterin-dependent oxidoreductase [Trueperaceae bacterium]|nr:molybdopterin-dependent oxidoreductase [Trueperaceae bacterium]
MEKHHNNTTPPSANTDIIIDLPDNEHHLRLENLIEDYPQSVIEGYTYVTNHGVHGPHRLEGVSLLDLIPETLVDWQTIEVISTDGFSNTLSKEELLSAKEPIMLYHSIGGERLEHKHGLVRLVVPTETDNALRQIKWVKRIVVS